MIEVLISDIIIKEDRRAVKSEYVQKLADSIKQIGLINPITITPDNTLIAGYHRLNAFILLGKVRIPAITLNLSDLETRLASGNCVVSDIETYAKRLSVISSQVEEMTLRWMELSEIG